MNIEDILSEIDAEIARLQQAKALLGSEAPTGSVGAKRKPGRPPSVKSTIPAAAKKAGKRIMSPEGRARIAAAQKARWAKAKRATKKEAKTVAKGKPGRPAKSIAKKASPKKAGARSESATA